MGGCYGGYRRPSEFLCLVLKMLQIQPDQDIIITFLQATDYKYVQLLGAFYLRLTAKPLEIYQYLEPLLLDYRKIRVRNPDGAFALTHVDAFIEDLLEGTSLFDTALPRLPPRLALERQGYLEPRVSPIAAEFAAERRVRDAARRAAEEKEDADERELIRALLEKERVERTGQGTGRGRRRDHGDGNDDHSLERGRDRDRDRGRDRDRDRDRDRGSRGREWEEGEVGGEDGPRRIQDSDRRTRDRERGMMSRDQDHRRGEDRDRERDRYRSERRGRDGDGGGHGRDRRAYREKEEQAVRDRGGESSHGTYGGKLRLKGSEDKDRDGYSERRGASAKERGRGRGRGRDERGEEGAWGGDKEPRSDRAEPSSRSSHEEKKRSAFEQENNNNNNNNNERRVDDEIAEQNALRASLGLKPLRP